LQRYWAVLRHHPEYFKLWTGQTISYFGSAITNLALPLTAATVLKASPIQMGVLVLSPSCRTSSSAYQQAYGSTAGRAGPLLSWLTSDKRSCWEAFQHWHCWVPYR
jgi:hypothetical protein